MTPEIGKGPSPLTKLLYELELAEIPEGLMMPPVVDSDINISQALEELVQSVEESDKILDSLQAKVTGNNK